ncbi:FAD-binding oxidoreductase [Kribbella sp. VKM Ac-2566]|uniref:FAD-binding oxidoreductase n=1 Tax=Kribbella sp. VKM Ac-2566 TaxID=2512218 RepID=UPI00106302E8|nr:FAD-binding oxidoreductase [Kribbella sp. VKM Ac-2566]TDW98638.1 FAD/FMN-containing dehydrogenase [Kribbella sp. VKM Ac-2566]
MTSLENLIGDQLLTPGSPGWTTAVTGFNTAAAHRPDLAVAAEQPDHVVRTVRYAAEHNLPVAVQATGHGISVPADGGILITTSRLSGVSVDARAGTATVQAGVRWDQVIAAAAPYGLAPLNGSSPLVGVVGYTLGGGLGPMARRFGYAADHVRWIDVVTADGVLRRADAVGEPELFWALRGGKGNFGVVTAMEFDLMPVRTFYGGGMYFPADSIEEVLDTWRQWTAEIPESLTTSIALLRLPDLPMVPEPLRGRVTAHVRVTFLGVPDDGERLLSPFRGLGPVLDTVVQRPYPEIGEVHQDPVDPMPVQERSILLDGFDEQAAKALLEAAGPGSDCTAYVVEVRHLGGAAERMPVTPGAFGNRAAPYVLATISPPDGMSASVLAALEPWGNGLAYINFLNGPGAEKETARAFEPAVYERLVELKGRYDPANLFRFNQNISPIGGRAS